MKRQFFIAAIAAVAMLASCMEKPADDLGNGKDGAARITIDLTDPTQSRAFTPDADADDADKKINNLIVFVTRAGGAFDVSPIFIDDAADLADNKFTVNATTKAEKIYIVTNTGAFATGPFRNVTTMADVEKVAAKLDGTTGNGSAIAPGNVWMSGQTTSALVRDTEAEEAATGDDVGIQQKKATIDLYYIPAKVFVIVKNSMTNYVGGKTVLQGVTITNAGVWTGFTLRNPTAVFGTDVRPDFRVARTGTGYPAQAPYYANGVVISAHPNDYSGAPAQLGSSTNDFTAPVAAYVRTTGFNAIQTAGGASTEDILTEADALYIFPAQLAANPADSSPEKVWVSVYGTYTAETTPAQRFWSAAFGGGDTQFKELKSGNKYIVTLELKGNGNVDGGEDEPSVETLTQYLNITVRQAAWNVSNPTKIFE